MGAARNKEQVEAAGTVAAIDIGTNSVRMVIAEVLTDSRIVVLEQFQRAVRLGQDTFRRGRLGRRTMQEAIAILRDYRRRLDFYQVEHIRAVATSAVREAGNTDTFQDRVQIAAGLNVEVISTSEESRLNVSAMQHNATNVLQGRCANALVPARTTDIGGGGALHDTPVRILPVEPAG